MGGSTGALGQGNDSLYGGTGNDHLFGGTGNDLLDGGAGNDNLVSSAMSSGGAGGSVTGYGNDTLEGGTGDDLLIAGDDSNTFRFKRDNSSVDLGTDIIRYVVSGAFNTLDFSEYLAGITLDLTGSSFSVTGQLTLVNQNAAESTVALGTFIQHVIGSALSDSITGDGGDNILEGGGGDDSLSGGAGRDILIGGEGADTLDGGAGEDLLIAGEVDFGAARAAALRAIQAEWLYTARSYAARIDNLLDPQNTGGLNGTYHLEPGESAFDDEVIDYLYGGDDLDWFLYADLEDPELEDVVEDDEAIGGVDEVLTDLVV